MKFNLTLLAIFLLVTNSYAKPSSVVLTKNCLADVEESAEEYRQYRQDLKTHLIDEDKFHYLSQHLLLTVDMRANECSEGFDDTKKEIAKTSFMKKYHQEKQKKYVAKKVSKPAKIAKNSKSKKLAQTSKRLSSVRR